MTSDVNNCYTNSVDIEEQTANDLDDYEDLPPMTTDGDDYTDANKTNSLSQSLQPIPYIRIYEPSKGFNDPRNQWLIPNCPLRVKIINVENNVGTHLLNPYLYTIEVQHSEYKWQVKKRHKHFQALHQQLIVYRHTLRIPLPSRIHRERRKSVGPNSRRPPPRFPRRPEALVSLESLEERKQQLEEYIQNCLKIPMYRNHHEMMSFLEISPLSFINELGHKGKEFLVMKRAGGFRKGNCFSRCQNCITDITGHWRKRWLVVKDNCILYLRPKDGKIRSVMLMDQGFEAKSGASSLAVQHSIYISNMSRELHLKCWTSRKSNELSEYLLKTAKTFAQDFTDPNRYESFSPVRENTWGQWFIDGANHFEAVADALESAKQEIFITDWWLSPHIFMRRPVIDGDHWRLDKILERKATQGVRVYILLYKEVELGLTINSLYTKQCLMKMHSNIRVLRHPDPVRGGPLWWTHHEKLVVIDQSYAFVGGIDLCFGRWDNYEHRLTDLGGIVLDLNDSTNKGRLILNSTTPSGHKLKSYSTTDIKGSMESVDPLNDSFKSNLSSTKSSEHIVKFDLNSNDVKVEEYENTTQEVNITESEFNIECDFQTNVKTVEFCDNIENIEDNNEEQEDQLDSGGGVGGGGTLTGGFKLRLASKLRNKRLQAVAKFQRMKQMTRKAHKDSVDDLNVMSNSEDELDIAITGFKSSQLAINGLKGASKLWFGKDYVNFIVKDFAHLHQPFVDLIDRNTTPRMPWHDLSCMVSGAAARDVARHFIERWNFTKYEKAKMNDTYPWLIPKSYADIDLIKAPKFLLRSVPLSCQVVRSVADWSVGHRRTERSILTAYIDLINSAKHYVFIENQFFITQSMSAPLDPSVVVVNSIGEALYHRIIRAFRDGQTFRVYVVFPLLPAFEGEIGTSRGVAIQAITHYNYATIFRGNNSLLARLKREVGDPMRYISFYGLRNYSELHGKLVTELVYVHSKLLLVDDNKAIIGSCNVNDRSMLGNRDSEVAVVLMDKEFDDGLMDGQPYKSGRFCGSLRRMIMREHLGLFGGKVDIDITDPISDAFYKDKWMSIAAKNSAIYERVFPVVPTDEVKTFSQLKEYLSKPKLANTDQTEAKRLLERVKGHLVLTPLYFLQDEDLTPSWGTGEKLMPEILWT